MVFLPRPFASSQSVIFFLASAVERPLMSQRSPDGSFNPQPDSGEQKALPSSQNGFSKGPVATPTNFPGSISIGFKSEGITTCLIGRLNFFAKSQSRSSWPGTDMIAP